MAYDFDFDFYHLKMWMSKEEEEEEDEEWNKVQKCDHFSHGNEQQTKINSGLYLYTVSVLGYSS